MKTEQRKIVTIWTDQNKPSDIETYDEVIQDNFSSLTKDAYFYRALTGHFVMFEVYE